MALPFTSDPAQDRSHRPDLLKGFLAGVIGGLVGTLVKTVAERIAPPQPEAATSPEVRFADKVTLQVADKHLPAEEEWIAEQAVHWSFGALIGGVYGALAESSPATTSAAGLPFGSALWTTTHRAMLPLLDLAPEPKRRPVEQQLNAFAGHLLYGLTVELVRRQVRKLLEE